eukprot:COSAG01_NODE_1544_length_9968_cov_20.144594_6_plen_76_part_00
MLARCVALAASIVCIAALYCALLLSSGWFSPGSDTRSNTIGGSHLWMWPRPDGPLAGTHEVPLGGSTPFVAQWAL